MGILTAGIGHFPFGGVGFLNSGNHLPANGAVGIIDIDKVKKVRSDAECQFFVGECCSLQFLGFEMWNELLE